MEGLGSKNNLDQLISVREEDYSGAFIVIEGIDSSGKKTQSRLLAARLEDNGEDVKYVEFPTYEDSNFGSIVSEFLRGEFGDRDEVPIEIMSMIYAMDRYQFKEEYQDFLGEGGVIIANRYSQSNIAFQTAECEEKQFDELVEWIRDLESRLPQPDEIFVLDIDPIKAQELMSQKELREYLKGEDKDINEEKVEFQKNVRENYLKLSDIYGWNVVKCMRNNSLRPIEEINDEIFEAVNERI